jgi:proteasome accessory factor A
LEWDDPWLKSLDLEYHNVDPQAGLYHGMVEEGQAPRFTTNDLVDLAKRQPPRNTRAFGRAEVIRHLASKPWPDLDEENEDRQHRRIPPYVINWSVLQIRGNSVFVMADPFRTYVQDSRDYCSYAFSRRSLESPSNQQDT